MLEELHTLLRKWKSLKDERKKLQVAYLTFSVIGVVVAGIIALIDADLGQRVAFISLLGIGLFLINAIMWHLVVENIQDKIKTTKKR